MAHPKSRAPSEETRGTTSAAAPASAFLDFLRERLEPSSWPLDGSEGRPRPLADGASATHHEDVQ
ncbi:MAG TPA: hypothetical protein QF665_01240, partial [Alphaproteobacteria bacterium]|nr:hypothetical protein [Rhodospirillales bacterium]HJN03723.1 hypothetical protein [Alphaproteobacteria bacterium]